MSPVTYSPAFILGHKGTNRMVCCPGQELKKKIYVLLPNYGSYLLFFGENDVISRPLLESCYWLCVI